MRTRSGELNMPHALTPYRRLRYLYPATVTNHPFIANLAVLPTVALIIFFRAKNPFIEKSVFFRPLGAVIDCLRFRPLSVRPGLNILGRSQFDSNCFEVYDSHI